MGAIVQRTKRVYIGADADKASIPGAALTAGDEFVATDTGYKYQWTGAAWVWPVPDTSITEAKIGPLAVTEGKIGALAVTEGKIGALAVTEGKIGALAVTNGKIGNLAVDAAKLAADAVETGKIKNLNVTTGKAALGFGRYVPRSINGWDFAVGDFVTNGANQVDGLDLSGIVPSGATGVVLLLNLLDDASNSYFQIYPDATHTVSALRGRTQVANNAIAFQGTIPINADRKMDYIGANLIFAGIDLAVLGWFI